MRAGIEFQLQAAPGADTKQLFAVLQQFQGELMKHQDIVQAPIQPLSVSVPQMFAHPDTTRAKSLGVAVGQIYDTMQAMFGALYVNDFDKDGRVWGAGA